MSIPIISLILYVLTKYASKKPGGLIPSWKKREKAYSEDVHLDEMSDFGVLGYQPSTTNQSVFGSAITRGATGEQAEAFVSSTEMAHYAYAGTALHCNVLYCTILYYIILQNSILYCTRLLIIFHYIISYYAVLYYITLHNSSLICESNYFLFTFLLYRPCRNVVSCRRD